MNIETIKSIKDRMIVDIIEFLIDDPNYNIDPTINLISVSDFI